MPRREPPDGRGSRDGRHHAPALSRHRRASFPRNDLLVLNTTRVFRARLLGTRDSGAPAEILLLKPLGDDRWEAMVHPGGKLKPGRVVHIAPGFDVTILETTERRHASRASSSRGRATVADAIERHGHVPLPPYIARADRASGRRALPDRVREGERLGGRADRRAALHAGAARRARGERRAPRRCAAARRGRARSSRSRPSRSTRTGCTRSGIA